MIFYGIRWKCPDSRLKELLSKLHKMEITKHTDQGLCAQKTVDISNTKSTHDVNYD